MKPMRSRKARMCKTWIMVAIMAVCLCSCQGSMKYRQTYGGVWGTTYHITYRADRNLADSISSVMDVVGHSLSAFDSTSIVSRINRGEDVVADDMLREVLELSQHVNELSGGAFDPTLAPLINLWGFGYADSGKDPTKAEIDSALAFVGIRDCKIGDDGRMIKKHPGTQFNFSAVAKGYGVDKVAEMLRRNACKDYMVEIGGEIAVSGVNSRGEEWHIQIDAPVEGISHNAHRVISITDKGIATSGNYRNFRETADGRRWHTISPVDGYPAMTTLQSVTVIAENTALADALATALMAMPDSAARALIPRLAPIEVITIP